MYAQRNFKWRNDRLGNSRAATIGREGSLLVAMANLLTSFGIACRPNELNNDFITNGWFDDEEIMNKAAPADAFPNDIQLVYEKRYHEDQEIDLSQIGRAHV